MASGARALLGDQGEKLSVVAMHSGAYYQLVDRKAIDYVAAADLGLTADGTPAIAGGSFQGAFGDVRIPTYMNMRVLVSDDHGANDSCNGKLKPRKPPAFAAHFDTQPGTGRTLSLCLWLNEGWTPAQGGHLRVFPAPLLHVDVEPLCDRAAIFCSHHMLHRVRPLQFVKVNPVYLLD
jgi:hypothetical protein